VVAATVMASLLVLAGCTGPEKSATVARSYVGEGVDEASSAVATAQLTVQELQRERIFVATADVALSDQLGVIVHASRHLAILVPPDQATAELRNEALKATERGQAGIVKARDAVAGSTGAGLRDAASALDAASSDLDAVTGKVDR
jgi:hypothetical protein